MKRTPLFAVCLTAAVAADLASGARLLGGFQVTIPNTFTAGTPAVAAEVNENFVAIASAVESVADELSMRIDDVGAFENVLSVSPSGTTFASVAAALASIAGASDTNRFLVQVGPGVFDEASAVVVPAFVTLRGSGALATVVRSTRSSGSPSAAAATVVLESGGAIENLSIENSGTSATSVAVFGSGLSRSTHIQGVVATAAGIGGSEHYAMAFEESDLLLTESQLSASGASSANVAFGSTDFSGPFAQPLLRDCLLDGDGTISGIGAEISSTAMGMEGCRINGDLRAIVATVNGGSRIVDSQVTTLGLNPVYEVSGSASILSGFVVFVGGNPDGNATRFKYVHCAKPNFDPVVNGFGSSIQ